MHTIKKVTRALALLSLLSIAAACKDEPPTVESATSARTKSCRDGGAEFNAESNECVCPYAAHWTGARCEPDSEAKAAVKPDTEAPAMATVAPVEPAEPVKVEEQKPEPAPLEPSPATGGLVDEALRRVCRQAKAHWVDDGNYCLCPKSQVLVGKACRDVGGRITDDACLRAVHKGKWKKGDCVCGPDQVFVPARGGCVSRLSPSDTPNLVLLRRVCESSLNHGKWDAKAARCNCPTGRIWHDEICQSQQKMTSRAVCESAFNQGSWDKTAKVCGCKPGYFWLNQQCLAARTVSEKAGCEAESSRGSWNLSLSRCICPGLAKWDGKSLRCVK